MSMAYRSPRRPRQPSRHTTTSSITMTRRHTPTPPLPHQANAIASQRSVTHAAPPFELFNLRSLSGHIICQSGGPLAWKCLRQDQTAQSLAEAKIIATNECIKELLSIKNRAEDLAIADATDHTTVYNNNKACIDWSSALTSKGIKHLNLHENKVRKAQASEQVLVAHIPGKLNSSYLLTKELKDAGLYRQLRDIIMVSNAFFLRHHHNMPTHMTDGMALSFYLLAATPIAAAMVMPKCSAGQSASNHVCVGRPARNASAPTYADIVSERSAKLGTNPATGQTVIRPSCQSLPSQGGVEVRHRKISSRQLSWWNSPSPSCDRDL